MNQLKLSDSGGTYKLQVGDVFDVVLESNPTTGFKWEPAQDNPPLVEQLGWEFTPYRRAAGASGTMNFHYKSIQAGEGTFKLVYHRPFDRASPPLHVFEVKLEITA